MNGWKKLSWGAAVVLGACVGDSTDNAASSDGGTVDGGAQDAAVPVDSGFSTDAGSQTTVDAAPEAGTAACDPSKPFDKPVLIAELNSAQDDGAMRLSNDELTAYFFSDRAGDGGTVPDQIWKASRATLSSAWSNVALLPGVSAGAGIPEYSPTATADGLLLALEVGANPDIQVSTRTNPASDFGAPGTPSVINSNVYDGTPFWRPDGAKLYFASQRTNATFTFDLWVAPFANQTFSAPTALSELNTAQREWFPVVSADDLTIYFSAERTDLGSVGGDDIFMATRAKDTDAFSNIKHLANVSSTFGDYPSWLSPDGCRLYLSSYTASGSRDLYVATRPK